jgi:hypothetical protein
MRSTRSHFARLLAGLVLCGVLLCFFGCSSEPSVPENIPPPPNKGPAGVDKGGGDRFR